MSAPHRLDARATDQGFALVLALLGLGASGFLFVQGQNILKTQQLSFDQKIDKAALGESQNANLLQDNIRKQAEVQAALAQLSDGQKQNAEQIATANRAYQELLKGRANWVVDETEATLNLASQQLLLSGNVPVAVNTLENIESRLSRFDQPELLPIKQAVSSDIAALKNRPYLDISGTSLRLDRLETAVAGLPGGIFAPSLSVGAGLGNLLRSVFPNSPASAISRLPWKRSRIQYSTAFTSWFVSASIALTRSAPRVNSQCEVMASTPSAFTMPTMSAPRLCSEV